MLKVEKFIGDRREATYNVPDGLVGFINEVLPRKLWHSLAQKGLDLKAAAQAVKARQPYSATIAVRERGVDKTVTVSVA